MTRALTLEETMPPVTLNSGAVAISAEVTSYVGRRREGASLRRLLDLERMITLTGPGGVGKTRLALRVAREVASAFTDGVVLVELAQLRDSALVPNLVADQLGLHGGSGLSAAESVLGHLRGRTVLLVLDNCEHIIDDCAHFVAAVLSACPQVAVLATSRQSIGVPGERVVPVPLLPVEDAVRLFAHRAAAVWPDVLEEGPADPAVAELCQRLDCLPLAIELAAARMRTLSPQQVLDRLSRRLGLLGSGPRTAPQRHRTLRATMDWSHELCSPMEQLVWARASVFAGSFDLASAEQVCVGGPVTAQAVLEAVDGLLDKCVLVRRDYDGAVRYHMLETLREYGQERLAAAGEQERVARAHRDWVARLVAAADAEWLSDRQLDWISRLRHEQANVRAAANWSLSRADEAGAVMRLVGLVPEYWSLRGLSGEARDWLTQALAETASDQPDRGLALRACATHSMWLGDLHGMRDFLARAAGVAEVTSDDTLQAAILYLRAFGEMVTARSKCVDLAAESCRMFRASGDVRGELHPLFVHGVSVAFREQDMDGARASLARLYDLATAAGDTFYRAMSLFGIAVVEVEFGDVEVAVDAAVWALRLDLRAGSDHGRAYRFEVLAWIADRVGDHQRAATLFGIAAAIWERIGSTPEFVVGFPHRAHTDQTREALGAAAFDKLYAVGRAMGDEQAVHYALDGQADAGGEAKAPAGPLSNREAQIAALVAEGLSNREIASRLVISSRTAEAHVQHILTKLGFNKRTQIASWVAARR